MNASDTRDADIVAWLDNAAQAPVPPAARERALAAIPGRRPRPPRLAGFGSHWVAAPSDRGVVLPNLGVTAATLLLLAALALIGAAVFVGSRQVHQAPAPARLVYELDGDIYLADAEGGNPVRVASGDLVPGAIWAPDGRHFLFHDGGAHIADADGRVVASLANLPGFGGYPVWSPDSTRLQAWTNDFTQLAVHGIDGSLQSDLSLPDGYTRSRETLGVWAPDGRSVWVVLVRGEVVPCMVVDPGDLTTELDPPACAVREAWELPIDGTARGRLRRDFDLTYEWSFARDGSRVAFSDNDHRLSVANSDGTDRRPVIRADGGASQGQGVHPVWSPAGDEIAYYVSGYGDRFGLNVVDVASGTSRMVVDTTLSGLAPYTWSPRGDEILLVNEGSGPGASGLWTVGTDGGEATLLVEGATAGEWQPVPPASTEPPGEPLSTSVAPTGVPVALQSLPTGRCALIVKQVHRFADMEPELATVLNAPPFGAPFRVVMETVPGGDIGVAVSVFGPNWGPSVHVEESGPNGATATYTNLNRPRPNQSLTTGFREVGTHVIELSSASTDCAARVVFEVTGPA